MKLSACVLFLLFLAFPILAQQTDPAADDRASNASTPVADKDAASKDSTADAAPAAKPAPALDLTPGPDGKLSQQQMQALFRVVAEKDLENDKLSRDYTYTERQVLTKLDKHGNAKSTETETRDVINIDGEQVERLIAKDDKALDAKDAAKEDAKVQKIIDKRKNESESDRKKRLEKEEKDREDGRKFVTEIADAYNFTLVGSEAVGGRDAWVIDGEPRPGFEPHMKESKFLTKFRGRVWVDKSDLQLSKMDVEALDTISWGLFLARFHKGSRFTLEQTRVNDEVWLPLQLAVKVDLKLALIKGYNLDIQQSYRDYKKFRTSSKIVGMSEVKDQK